ncbi:MAG: NADH-dependent [FeFe] hydrogenase, group A6, partial [Bacteroidales bacterium]
MEKVQLTIDDKQVEVPKGTTIYKAAKEVGIDIPVLCYMNLEDIGIENKPGGCRVCSVEVEGRKNLAPACATEVYDGMEVKTHTMRVINARRTVVEFILSDHPKDCLTCKKSGNCELQNLAIRLGIREIPGQEYAEMSTYKTDYSPSIVRELDKCIMCRRCEKMCNEFQTVGALYAFNRGFNAAVAPAFEMDLQYSPCTYCGQCVAVCPTAALTEVDHSRDLIDAISDPNTTVIAQTAPAVRAALGEEFGYEPGTLVTGKMVSALRRLGFDYVFDTDFAADLTIMEEGTEMLDRLSKYLDGHKDVQMPILTSCCPAWVNFIEHHFPDLKDVPSSARSPQQMFGSIAKTYFAEQINKKRENVVVVSIMPCLAKKYESQREEFKVDDNPDVDFSVTTRELAHLIKEANFNLKDMEDQDFDRPMGESTGAGVMFGTTGGVIEAATRTAYEWYTGNALDNSIVFEQLRGFEGIRKATVDFKGTNIDIGIAHGLGNARKLLEAIKEGTSEFHAIEIMACPGGCIGGGGQPLHHN